MNVEQKQTDEIVQLTFPYAREIGSAAIINQNITVTVLDGTDATPAATLLGAAQVSGNEVRQLVQAGLANVRYKYHCLAIFDDGRKLAREYGLDVLPT